MHNVSEKWTPAFGAIVGRILGLILLASYWMFYGDGHSPSVVVLLLAIAAASIARWRFSLPEWTVLLDQAVCFVVAYYWWPDAWYAMAFPTFETMLSGRIAFALPVLVLIGIFEQLSVPLLSTLTLVGFAGWMIYSWSVQIGRSRTEADQERRYRYELEQLKEELLAANVHAARYAEIAERYRISLKLHDHAGHELTAAILALQAFEQLWQENNPQAATMFDQAQKRLANGLSQLRETVRDISPVQTGGVQLMEHICRTFTACPVDMKINGDASRIEAHLWSILESCLKEALTNVARHSNAERVTVELDIGARIVRLSVHNAGVARIQAGDGTGIGIRNLRHRAKYAGGSVATDDSDGFRIVCVLPIGRGNPA